MHVKILSVQTSHFKDILVISEECFGLGYININSINTRQKANTHDIVLMHNNRVIGFCLVNRIKIIDENSNYYDHIKTSELPTGVIESIAIHPDFQNQGYGSIIINSVLNQLRLENFKTILYPAWLENDRVHFLDKLKAIGLLSIQHYQQYWYSQSLLDNFKCKRCGEPPCKCSMELLKLSL